MSRAFLHVGSPKTGTTFLQAVLWQARDQLREDGVLLPGRSIHQHFQASLEVRDTPERARFPEMIAGAWQRLLDQIGDWDRDILISHELFAITPAERARDAVADLVARGFEPHLVLTARDLARQLPAEWQERLKHKGTISFADFMAGADDPTVQPLYDKLWGAHDYAGILERWAAGLPGDQVHLVTVPPAGAPAVLLWERFAGVLGIDPGAYSLDVPKENSSLGLEQATLLRELNLRLGPGRLPMPGTYTGIGKGALAHQVLAAHRGTRLTLGGEDLAFARARSEQILAALRARPLTVHGDLADLEIAGDPASTTSSARVDVTPEVLLEEALCAMADFMAAMGERVERWDAERRRLEAQIAEARAELAARPGADSGQDQRLGQRTRAAVRRSLDSMRGRGR